MAAVVVSAVTAEPKVTTTTASVISSRARIVQSMPSPGPITRGPNLDDVALSDADLDGAGPGDSIRHEGDERLVDTLLALMKGT
jgi:hypothetical protein